MKATLDENNTAMISKEREYIKANFEATKTNNCILLSENSRIHPVKEELHSMCNEISQFKEARGYLEIEKLL